MNKALDDFPNPHAAVEATQREIQEFRDLLAEKERRKIEALRLYEPTSLQDSFHKCPAKERLFQAGNQVGKSLCAFAEDARAVTGQDPYRKYPQKDGILVCVGLDDAHIGRVIHKYLFRPGAFKIIRDEETQAWRAWKPWMASDLARRSEAKDAPPLIPKRFIKQFAWRKRAQNVFDSVELTTGWIIYAFGSKSEPAAGFQADLVHIDEDIERQDWYDEMVARLSMRRGRLIWSALPLAKNDALVNVADRADDEKGSDNPSTVCFRASIHDNPYMPQDTREENIKRWMARGEDEYRKRALGELTIDSRMVYPSFDKELHNAVPLRNDGPPPHRVQSVLADANGIPPEDWCRYMVVDPGHKICAVLFFAVPPPKQFGDFRICYDECYIRQCDAEKFAKHVESKAKDHCIQAFIIDAHGGRLRSIATGVTPRSQYSKELKNVNVYSVETKFGFRDGCDDINGRELALRGWLSTRQDGMPTLLISPRCHNTIREMLRFKKKLGRDGKILDEADRRYDCHAVECLEYAAADGLKYVKPKSRRKKVSVVSKILKERKLREARRRAQKGAAGHSITLGPRGT